MHALYEGIFYRLFYLIMKKCSSAYKEFDDLLLKNDWPSFIKRRPRSLILTKEKLKAIECYCVMHYYFTLFEQTDIDTDLYINIKKFIDLMDKLYEDIEIDKLNSIQNKITKVLRYLFKENKEFTHNIHVTTKMTLNTYMFGPISLNSVFIFE